MINPNVPSIQEIEEIVMAISEEIVSQIDTETIDITVVSNGFVGRIDFCDVTIWCSEMDDREILDNGEKEDLDTHLRRVINEEVFRLEFLEL